MQSCQRACESADGIGNHRIAERRIAFRILVRVDQHRSYLGRKPREHVRNHRLAVQFDQPLVDAAHAPAHAAGQDDARYMRHRAHAVVKRCAPVKSR